MPERPAAPARRVLGEFEEETRYSQPLTGATLAPMLEEEDMGIFGWSLPPGCHTLPGEEPEAPQPRCHCGSFLKAQPDEVWHTQRRVQDCGRREVAERRG